VRKKKINIVIPSLTVSSELINCLLKFNNQRYKNFFVTIVLDFSNKKKIPNLNYKLNILIVGNKTMSFKRNLGVKRFKSDFIVFLDSDAYAEKNWLLNGVKILNNKKNYIIGGPSIPFPKQSMEEMMCYYAKRSYFVTGYLNFRKYKSNDRYCDWVESCNMMMHRDLFLNNKGMNEKIYVGEDKECIERFKKQNKSIKVFFSSKIFIYHKERGLFKFLLQRIVFGSNLYNITNFNNKLSSFQPLLPLTIVLIFISSILFINDYSTKIKFVTYFFVAIQVLILFDIFKYLKDIRKILFTLIIINLANISFVIGNIFQLMGIKDILRSKIYLKSRNNL
jgi:GT2 family glycosyltransferase